MPLYRYRAVGADGRIVEGRHSAPNDRGVVARLRRDGRVPLEIAEAETEGWTDWRLGSLFAARQLSGRRLARLCLDLATLLRAGVAVDRAIEIQRESSDDRQARVLLDRLHESLRRGRTLSEAMEKVRPCIPSTLTSVIRAAERSGDLATALDSIGQDLERASALQGRFVSALIYPCLLLVFVCASLVLVVTVVIPEFKPLFDQAEAELPGATRTILAISEFMRDSWWMPCLAILIGVLAVRALLRDPASRLRWDAATLTLPVIGPLIVKIHAAQGGRLMGMMLRNGVPAIDALVLVEEAERNACAAQAYRRVIEHVRAGRRLGPTFRDHPLFRGFAAELVSVGEHAGKVDESFLRIATYCDESANHALQRLVAVLAPALTILLGLLVAAVIASVLLALLSVNSLVI